MKTNIAWINLLSDIFKKGTVTYPRGHKTVEILANQTEIDMNQPVMSVIPRAMGYRFMVAEAWWILSGQNRVSTISPYSRMISDFSDDGIMFNGAYGPKIVDQLSYVVDTLYDDLNSRQAIINIWRENPRKSKDIPCTLSVQFIVRNGVLHCIDTMRSSDAWLGWIYDVFNFSCLSMWIILALRQRGVELKLGSLTLQAGSQHLYDRDSEKAASIVRKFASLMSYDDVEQFVVAPVDLDMFDHPDELVQYLKDVADHHKGVSGVTEKHWLKELPHIDEAK